MSTLVTPPDSSRRGLLRGGRRDDMVVMINHITVCVPTFAAYVEFLELVYETKVAIKNKKFATWVIIPRGNKSEAGLRVSGWLYDIDYTLLGPQ